MESTFGIDKPSCDTWMWSHFVALYIAAIVDLFTIVQLLYFLLIAKSLTMFVP